MNILINIVLEGLNSSEHKTISIQKNSVIEERFCQQKKDKVCRKIEVTLNNIKSVIYSSDWVRIVAVNDEYTIQQDDFTEQEYLWLGKEISNFLDIKLEKMPKIRQVSKKYS